jgi:choline dehydrogenase-like flavoprotein
MIVDINELNSAGTRADICIIGSGAAGIAIAREFDGCDLSVILLEGGGQIFEPASQDPYRSEIVGINHAGIHRGRARVIGGTTTLWAGQALPLAEVDFEPREWVPYSGWPIDRSVLKPFYKRAEDVMQIPHATYDAESWPQDTPPPQYDPNKITTFYSQFAAIPDFARKYRSLLEVAPNIKLITHANAVSLQAGKDATDVKAVEIRSFEGKNARIVARIFIVCCGGIDSARLLLVSNSVEPAGIGNRFDVVGRYFQDHPGMAIPIQPRNIQQFRKYYNSFRRNESTYAIKMATSKVLQREKRILHVGGEIYYPPVENDPIDAAKCIVKAIRSPHLRSEVPNAMRDIARNPLAVVGAVYRRLILRQSATFARTKPHLGIGCEQEPNPMSRVMLSRQTDALGVRRTALDWRMTDAQTMSIHVYLEALADEWKRLAIADIDLSKCEIDGRERGLHGGFVDAFHHMGTTRMGKDLKTSVVDEQCRVHGYHNLYIGSTSVFPTSGFSNPTLTLLALSLRIADNIKSKLSAERGSAIT